MVDVAQATRVAGVAAALLGGVQPKPNAEARRELRWSAALHETGMMISHHAHHRHSAYVLPSTRLSSPTGCAGSAISCSASAAACASSRRSSPSLPDSAIICLRLAVIVCHARDDVDPGAITLAMNRAAPAIVLRPAWADSHPRALHLLREEIDAWAKTGVLEPSLDLA